MCLDYPDDICWRVLMIEASFWINPVFCKASVDDCWPYLIVFWTGSGGDKDKDAEKVQIKSLEEAFQRIREVTGENDIDLIVTNFIRRENENFALFQYVNEINDEVEQLQDEINNMKMEIKQFEKDDIKNEGVRIQMLKDLEVWISPR